MAEQRGPVVFFIILVGCLVVAGIVVGVIVGTSKKSTP
jgi:hypothetical protein